MTALPFIASPSSPRNPAVLQLPLPEVSIQCIALEGPAWNTVPPLHANSHMWLSDRNSPCASLVSNGLAGMPGSSVDVPPPTPGVQSSAVLLPMPPLQEPPTVKTLLLERVTVDWYPRGTCSGAAL